MTFPTSNCSGNNRWLLSPLFLMKKSMVASASASVHPWYFPCPSITTKICNYKKHLCNFTISIVKVSSSSCNSKWPSTNQTVSGLTRLMSVCSRSNMCGVWMFKVGEDMSGIEVLKVVEVVHTWCQLQTTTTTSLLKHSSRSYLLQFFLQEVHQRVFLVKWLSWVLIP